MIVIGLLLLLAGLLLGGYVVAGGLPGQTGTDVTLSLLGLTVETSAVVIFAMGVLTLLLLELGVLAMRSGARKSAKRRAELQRLRRVEAEVQSRQSSEAQRNATAAVAAPAAPAPFARREPAPTRPDSTPSDATDSAGPGDDSDDFTAYQPRTAQEIADARRTDDTRVDVDPSTRPPATDGTDGSDGTSSDRT